MIEVAFADLPLVQVIQFEPLTVNTAQKLEQHSKAQSKSSASPGMTRARALLLHLFDRYKKPGYGLGRLEAQKLAYFLQAAGEPLKLHYERSQSLAQVRAWSPCPRW
ncbi:hypothetical protein [Spirulina major]|uniref:hypothetical protein n=1 Tax=Spirulina major TaxID=270636 RepID=UPI000933963A|nr:hypothetical protein [Spirulina major]